MIVLHYEFGEKSYDYDCYYTEKDVVDYLIPPETAYSERELGCYRCGIMKVINECWLNLDKIDEDRYFEKFLLERYRQDALKEFESYDDAEED